MNFQQRYLHDTGARLSARRPSPKIGKGSKRVKAGPFPASRIPLPNKGNHVQQRYLHDIKTRLSNGRPSQKGVKGSKRAKATAFAEAPGIGGVPPPPTFFQRWNQFLLQQRTLPIPRWVSPQQTTISLSECFGHGSFILVAISYSVDDFIRLRLLAIAGSSAMLVFNYFHPHGRVLWLPFKWNVLFIAINLYRVFKVHIDRYFATQLSPIMIHMHHHHFYLLDLGDYARLVREGWVEEYKKGELVVAQDQENRFVRLVLTGELKVLRDDQITYKLHEGNFISESGLHAGLLLRGNVNSCCDVVASSDKVTVLTWDRTELMHLLEIDKNIQHAIKAVMSWDIVSKLKSQRHLLAKREIEDPEIWTIKRREQTLSRYKAILSNMLAHPDYLNKRKEELHKYREIHHIEDNEHEMALLEMGWTVAEFETGVHEGQVDDDEEEVWTYQGWKWYLHDLYLRILS
eukprot:Nitzschia sp. Nitz4//scaffold74_size92883//17280//18656//NITZ4_004815-RA/size92883-processed-gene-0.27-mRNA-1//-1//CDS//3329557571//5244//frame0